MAIFGEILKAARKKMGYTQSELSERILNADDGKKLSQSRLSDWERGNSLPKLKNGGDSQIIADLAMALELDEKELRMSCEVEREQEPTAIMSERKYLWEIAKFIEELENKISLWLIGPRTLPVKESPSIRDNWVANLNLGINYHIIWFLDGIKYDDFKTLIFQLTEIGKRANGKKSGRKNTGAIYHHPIQLDDKNEIKFIYEKILNNGSIERNKFKNIRKFTNLSEEMKKTILTFWQSFASIVLFKPNNEGYKPLASLSLQRIHTSRTSKPKELFVFFDLERTLQLLRFVEEIEFTNSSRGE